MYPKFKLIMFAGSEGVIHHYAKYSPGYRKYIELMAKDDELIQPGYNEIVEQLRKPGRVAAVGLERVISCFAL